MEGTHVRSDPVHDSTVLETEDELEDRFVELANATAGAAWYAGRRRTLTGW